jgi:hypothetical protein
MILIGGLGISFWIAGHSLADGIRFSIDYLNETPSLRLAIYRAALLLSRPVQPIVSIWTLTLLILAVARDHSRIRRLACQPGFVACTAAALVILVVGLLNLATLKHNFVTGLPLSVRMPVCFGDALTFTHAECGIAVAGAWMTMILGRRWRPGRDWIDRGGLALGLFWIAMVPVTWLGPHVLEW